MHRVFVGGLTLVAALSSNSVIAAQSPDAAAPVIVPRASATAIVATDVAVTLGSVRIVVPRLEARGTELTRERLTVLLDPSSSLSLSERLDSLTAASLTAARVEIAPAEGQGSPIVLSDIALTDVMKGRVGSLSVGKVTTEQHSSAGTGSAALGPVSATALDLPLAVSMAQSHRSDAAEPVRLLIGSLSTGGMAIHTSDGTDVGVGGIALAGLRGRAPLRPYADLLPLRHRPEGMLTPEDRRQLAEAAVDATGSVALDHLALERVATAEATGSDRFRMARLVLDDVSPARIGSWAIDDVDLVADDTTTIALRHFALHGPDESILLAYLASSFASGDGVVQREPMPRLPPQDGSMAIVDLRISTPSQGTPGNSADGVRDEITIPVASASTTTEASGAVTGTSQFGFDYALPKPEVLPQADLLRAGGIDTLHAGLDWHVSFDQAARELRLGRFAVSAEKLGSLATTLTLGHLPVAVPAGGGGEASGAATRAITLREAGFTFTNAGIVELTLPALAASAQTSLPLFKAGLKTEAELTIGRLLGTSPTASRLVAAVDAFIDDPKTFTLKIEAPEGLTIGEIQDAPDPTALLDRLGIEATADR